VTRLHIRKVEYGGALRSNVLHYLRQRASWRLTLTRLFDYGFGMRQTTLGQRAVDGLEDLGAVAIYPDHLVYLTECGINTVAAMRCRSTNHARSMCYGFIDPCPMCGTPHCYEDGAGDDIDNRFPNICDSCVFGITRGNPDVFP
jgi:hypothetical protein